MSLLRRHGARSERNAGAASVRRWPRTMRHRPSAAADMAGTNSAPGKSPGFCAPAPIRDAVRDGFGSGAAARLRFLKAAGAAPPACTLARVEAALGREMDARGAVHARTYRHRIPLGLAMLEQGWITPIALRTALAAQRTAGSGRLGEWLVRQRSSSEELVTRALGLQWGCPVLSMEFHNPEDLTALLPRLFIDAFGALPLRVAAGRILYLGFEDRVDPALALATERMTGLHVEAGLVRGSFFRPAHARALESRFPSVELIEAATEQALAMALDQGSRRIAPRGGAPGAHPRLLLAAHLAPAPGPGPCRTPAPFAT